jgi:hypothetical protein
MVWGQACICAGGDARDLAFCLLLSAQLLAVPVQARRCADVRAQAAAPEPRRRIRDSVLHRAYLARQRRRERAERAGR